MDLQEGSKPCPTCLDLKSKLEEVQKLYDKKDRLSKLLKEYLCTKHSAKIKQEILPLDYDKRPTKDIEDNNYLRQRIVTLTDTIQKLIEEKQSVYLINSQNKILIDDYENNQKNFKYANQQLHRQLLSVAEELDKNKKLLSAAEMELAELKKKNSRKKKAKDNRVIKEVISSLTQNSELDIVADGEVKAEDIFYPTPVSSTVQSPATSIGSEFPTSTRSPTGVDFASSPAPDFPPSPDHPCDSSTKAVYINDSDESVFQSLSETSLEENCTNRQEITAEEENSVTSEENNSTPEKVIPTLEENHPTPEKNRLSPEKDCSTQEENRLTSEKVRSIPEENHLSPEKGSSTQEENHLNSEECTSAEQSPVSKPSSIVKPITPEKERMDKPDLLPTHSTPKSDKNVFPHRTFTSKNITSVNPFAFRRNSPISPAKLIFANTANRFKIPKCIPNSEIVDTLLSNLRNLSLKDPEKINLSNKKRLDDIQYKLDTTSFNFYRDRNSFKQVTKNEKFITLTFPTDDTQKTFKLEGDPKEAFQRLKKITEKSTSFEDFIKYVSSESKPESNLFMTALAQSTFSNYNSSQFNNELSDSNEPKNSLFQQKFHFENTLTNGMNKSFPRSLFATDEGNSGISKFTKCPQKFSLKESKLGLFTLPTRTLTDDSDSDGIISKIVNKSHKKKFLEKSKLDLSTLTTPEVSDGSESDSEKVKIVSRSQEKSTTGKAKLDTSSLRTPKLTDESDLYGRNPKMRKNSTKENAKLDSPSQMESTYGSDPDEKSPIKLAKTPMKRSKVLSDATDSEGISKTVKGKKPKSKLTKKYTQNLKCVADLSTADETESEIEENTPRTRSSLRSPRNKFPTENLNNQKSGVVSNSEETPKHVIRKKPESNINKKSTQDLTADEIESEIEENTPRTRSSLRSPRKKLAKENLKNQKSEVVSNSEETPKHVIRKKPESNLNKKSTRDLTADETESEIEENKVKAKRPLRSSREKLVTENLNKQKSEVASNSEETPKHVIKKKPKSNLNKKSTQDLTADETESEVEENVLKVRSPLRSLIKKVAKENLNKQKSEVASNLEEIRKKVLRKESESNLNKKLTQDLTADETKSEIAGNTLKTKSVLRRKKLTMENSNKQKSDVKNEEEPKNESSDKEENCPVPIKKPKIESKKNKTIEKLRKSARLIKLKLPVEDEPKLDSVKIKASQVPPECKFPDYQVTTKGVKVHLPPLSLEKRRKAAEIFKKPPPPKPILFVPETKEVKSKEDEEFDSLMKELRENYKPVPYFTLLSPLGDTRENYKPVPYYTLLSPLGYTDSDDINSDEKREDENPESKEQEVNVPSEELKPNEEILAKEKANKCEDENPESKEQEVNVPSEELKPNEEILPKEEANKCEDENPESKEQEVNVPSEEFKPNEEILAKEEAEPIYTQISYLFTDIDSNKTEVKDLIKNDSAILNSTSESKNVDNANSKHPDIEEDFDFSESSEIENESKVDDVESEKEKLFANLDKSEEKISDEPKQENDDMSDLLNYVPVGFYSKPEEEENIVQVPQSSKNTVKATKKIFGKRVQENSETTESLDCKNNALDCAWNYFTSVKPKKINAKKEKRHTIKKARLGKIKKSIKRYLDYDDYFSMLPKVVSQLHQSANHQVAEIIVKVLCEDHEACKLLSKNSLETTPTQDKILALIFSILLYQKTFLEDILSRIEREIASLKTTNVVEVNVSLGQVHTMVCRKYGLSLRTRTLIYDLLYWRKFRAYPILNKILSLWPKAFPNHRKTEKCLIGHTIAKICKQVPSVWNPHSNIIKNYGMSNLHFIFHNLMGYCDKYGFTYTYDDLFLELVKNIEYEGNDKAFILLSKCVGFKYSCGIIKRDMYPKMVPTTDENLLVKLILTSAKVCKGFPGVESALFMTNYICLVGQILHQSTSLAVCEAVVEALAHVKKFDVEAITSILWNWKPEKLSMKCASHIRKIFCGRSLISWKFFIDDLKNNQSKEVLL